MRSSNKSGSSATIVNLLPGQYHVTGERKIITTLLGSCIAVCLYDPVNEVMGMNHFLLSNERYMRKGPMCVSDAGRYGVHAMEIIINQMLEKGAKRKYFKAKAFGGASVLNVRNETSNFPVVSEVNVRFIREFLEMERIPLVASDLGGEQGRKIRFDGSDYSVYVQKIKSIDKSVIDAEKRHWRRTIEKHKQEETHIELWS